MIFQSVIFNVFPREKKKEGEKKSSIAGHMYALHDAMYNKNIIA